MCVWSGSRVDKHWFIVRDSSVKTERLLTLVPKSANCPIQCDSDSRQIILDLFLALHHPYIYPVLDLEFREGAQNSQTFIVLVLPFNSKGSLKDLIYKVRNICLVLEKFTFICNNYCMTLYEKLMHVTIIILVCRFVKQFIP